MCDSPATSREHVPPRSLFPKSKDLDEGVDFRSNLVTVPSCSTHNLDKSKDDQYFLNVVASLDLINETGRNHYLQQIRRQNRRNPSILARFASRSFEEKEKLGYEVEIERIDYFVDHLARAIYYAHYGTRWESDMHFIPEFLARPTGSEEELQRKAAIAQIDATFDGIPFQGVHALIFKYQVIENHGEVQFRFHIYDGCKVYVAFNKTDVGT
jgi:hypothetical protein